jgi:hypothetical protein
VLAFASKQLQLCFARYLLLAYQQQCLGSIEDRVHDICLVAASIKTMQCFVLQATACKGRDAGEEATSNHSHNLRCCM